MLSKLLKYEFKATCRIYGGLYLAILAAAALLGAFFRELWKVRVFTSLRKY